MDSPTVTCRFKVMNTVKKILPLIYLINARYQQVGNTHIHYGALMRNIEYVRCKLRTYYRIRSQNGVQSAATYNNGTRECICLDRKTGMTSQLGNSFWRRQFHGFLYNAQLEWRIELFVNIQRTQAEAETFCNALEGRLAVVDTDEKLNYIIGLPDYKAEQMFFVDATDEETERVFVWSNGNFLTTNWGPDEPNRYRDENWIAIYRSAFVDAPCGTIYDFACEIV